MRRLYCDRCQKEVDALHVIRIIDKLMDHGTYHVKEVEVCKCCKDFVEKSEEVFNRSMTGVRIAFYETLFSNSVEPET